LTITLGGPVVKIGILAGSDGGLNLFQSAPIIPLKAKGRLVCEVKADLISESPEELDILAERYYGDHAMGAQIQTFPAFIAGPQAANRQDCRQLVAARPDRRFNLAPIASLAGRGSRVAKASMRSLGTEAHLNHQDVAGEKSMAGSWEPRSPDLVRYPLTSDQVPARDWRPGLLN
jgi:hypothetical protein